MDNKEPLYKIAEKNILELLKEKPYSEGFYLPTELELMKRFSVSRHTIRRAMDSLVLKSIVEREKGKGTRLIMGEKPHVKTKLNDWKSLTEEMTSRGYSFSYKEKNITMIFPDEKLQKIFSMQENKDIVSLERMVVDVTPVVYFISYFNPILNLDRDREFLKGKFRKLYEYLEKNYDIKMVRSEEEITAEMPNNFIKKKLELPKNVPVLCRKRLVYDDKNNLIEYNIGYYNSERFSYNVSLEKS